MTLEEHLEVHLCMKILGFEAITAKSIQANQLLTAVVGECSHLVQVTHPVYISAFPHTATINGITSFSLYICNNSY
jgi:hypothetical protein